MKPSVGRIVHYTNLGDREGKYPPEIQAAIITKVSLRWTDPKKPLKYQEDGCVISLRIFYEDGEFIMRDVPFTPAPAGTEKARGHWAWPAPMGPIGPTGPKE